MKKGQFADSKFINVFILEKTVEAIVVTDLYVINLSFEEKTVLWYIEMQNIIKVERVSETALEILLKRESKHFEVTKPLFRRRKWCWSRGMLRRPRRSCRPSLKGWTRSTTTWRESS